MLRVLERLRKIELTFDVAIMSGSVDTIGKNQDFPEKPPSCRNGSQLPYFTAEIIAQQLSLAKNTFFALSDDVENLEPVKGEKINRVCTRVGVFEGHLGLCEQCSTRDRILKQ